MDFIQRDYSLIEEEDLKINVFPKMPFSMNINNKRFETHEVMLMYNDEGNLVGWKIQNIYE